MVWRSQGYDLVYESIAFTSAEQGFDGIMGYWHGHVTATGVFFICYSRQFNSVICTFLESSLYILSESRQQFHCSFVHSAPHLHLSWTHMHPILPWTVLRLFTPDGLSRPSTPSLSAATSKYPAINHGVKQGHAPAGPEYVSPRQHALSAAHQRSN